MLTYAIGFVQNVQFVCFALVLGAMAWQDRSNRALRYIAAGYTSGLVGALLAFADHRLPLWLGVGVAMEAAPAAGHARVERLRTALSEHFFKLDSRPVRITASFGIAAAAWPAATSGKDSWQQLLTEADVALYAAKNAGRNQARTYHAGLEAATPPAQSATVAATAASLGPSSMNDSIADKPSGAGL